LQNLFFLNKLTNFFMKGDAAPSESMEVADDADDDVDADADIDADADFDQTGDDVTWTVWFLALLKL
jgi:hypothetical protein